MNVGENPRRRSAVKSERKIRRRDQGAKRREIGNQIKRIKTVGGGLEK